MFKRNTYASDSHTDTMNNLKALYNPAPIDPAAAYAQEAMNDANQQAAPDDNEDCSDLG